MSIKLPNKMGKNLYDFWQEKLSQKLGKEKSEYIVNLASQEYSSAIEKLDKKIINIAFKEKKNDQYKVIGIHAKKARGVMANFIIRNKINTPEDLKSFKLNNYRFIPELSSKEEYVFAR